MEKKSINSQRISFFIFLFLFSFSFTDCSDKCEETNYFVYYEPTYSTSAEIKSAVKLTVEEYMIDNFTQEEVFDQRLNHIKNMMVKK